MQNQKTTQQSISNQQYIRELQNENIELKEKYEKLSYKYKVITQKLKEKIQKGLLDASLINDLDLTNTKQINYQKWDIQGFWGSTPQPQNQEQTQSLTKFQQWADHKSSFDQENEQITQIKLHSPKKEQAQDDNFNSIIHQMSKSNISKKSSSTSEKAFPLIEGCFIIEKKDIPLGNKSVNALLQMTEFTYPDDLLKTQKQTLQMVIRYIFGTNLSPTKIEDDQFDSRKNQIIYGTPYDDFSFAFEDHKWNNKKQIPEIMRLMGTMKKKYVYVLLRPQLIDIEKNQKQNDFIEKKMISKQQSEEQGEEKEDQEQGQQKIEQKQILYETDIVYGFISSFPLRVFFQDLHRTIQQQVKYAQFSHQADKQLTLKVSRSKKFQIIGQIMQRLTEQNFRIKQFPIKHNYKTGMAEIQINIPTVSAFQAIETQYFKQTIYKYNFVKVSKLLHYTLAERFIIVEAKTKKMLNQIVEMIRIMIKPFFWIFAIVYNYSEYFEPFLSSPMPIIIGKLSNDDNFPEDSDIAEFDRVMMDTENCQLKDSEKFYKSIRRLKKLNDKQKNSREILIQRYLKSLKNFITKGVLDSQPTDFHIEFMDTQMVSYYKDLTDK